MGPPDPLPRDAEAFTVVWRDERNSPFGGVVGSGLSLDGEFFFLFLLFFVCFDFGVRF